MAWPGPLYPPPGPQATEVRESATLLCRSGHRYGTITKGLVPPHSGPSGSLLPRVKGWRQRAASLHSVRGNQNSPGTSYPRAVSFTLFPVAGSILAQHTHKMFLWVSEEQHQHGRGVGMGAGTRAPACLRLAWLPELQTTLTCLQPQNSKPGTAWVTEPSSVHKG